MPFAGKTTLVEELVKRFGWTGVDLDEINTNRRLGIHGNDVISVKDWKITYRMSYDMVDQALKAGKTVINDSTNFTREQRDKLREIANKYSVPSKVIYVNIPEKTARERWKQNRNTKARYDVKDEDFAEVTNNFQIPTADENGIYYDQTSPIDEWIKKNITEAV